MSTEPVAQTGARCALHGERPAVGTCTRCGNFVCTGCEQDFKSETYCTACAGRLGYKTQSKRAVAAFVLGVLPFITWCVPLGIPAIILGHMELKAIEEGDAPVGGRNLALIGTALGWLGIAISIFVGIALLLMVAASEW